MKGACDSINGGGEGIFGGGFVSTLKHRGFNGINFVKDPISIAKQVLLKTGPTSEIRPRFGIPCSLSVFSCAISDPTFQLLCSSGGRRKNSAAFDFGGAIVLLRPETALISTRPRISIRQKVFIGK